MHRLSERVLLECLKSGGLVVGDVDEMMSAHLAATFMPHGLGHLMGLDVHDVGGYPKVTDYLASPLLPYFITLRLLLCPNWLLFMTLCLILLVWVMMSEDTHW